MTPEEIKKVAKEMQKEQKLDIYTRRFLRKKEAVERYPLSEKKLMELVYDGGAVIKLEKTFLIDTVAFEKYLETFRIEGGYRKWKHCEYKRKR